MGWTDASAGRYYLADQSNKSLDVFDTHENTFVKRIPGFVGFSGDDHTSGPAGVVSISRHEVWVGDGDSSVKVVDIPTGAVVDSISTGGKARADGLAYDPQDGLVVTANDADSPAFLTFISVPNHAVKGRILVADATDGIKQTVYDDTTRLFYTAIPSTTSRPGGEIRVFDADLVLAGTKELYGCNPHGLTLGPAHQLLVGCNASTHVVIVDDTTLNVLADISQAGGAEEVWYNPGDNQYYVAENDQQGLAVIDAGTMTFVGVAQSGLNAHSVAVDERLNHVFVPIAAPDLACPRGCIAVFATVTGDRAAIFRTP